MLRIFCVHDCGADLRLACHLRRATPVVLPDERPRPVQPLFCYLEEVRLVQDADILDGLHNGTQRKHRRNLPFLFESFTSDDNCATGTSSASKFGRSSRPRTIVQSGHLRGNTLKSSIHVYLKREVRFRRQRRLMMPITALCVPSKAA